ncbi:phage tail assembly chaperone [Algimonas porphyrae]|uniref:Phage tail assembly chaperone n=1 Tax=Algimonas porphyrae TaxID=1128113 RepID=A0ABQ5UXL2_9PROT|nr:phage tail assembly chaperone [Algimonas porphyrae]GLQ19659.1 hypothetical protein GCM10007854_06140 [Algimonas porphyrae]
MTWPFDEWHRLAVRHLQLSPSEFWAMPLADWLSLIAIDRSALDRSDLNKLMKDHPDGIDRQGG